MNKIKDMEKKPNGEKTSLTNGWFNLHVDGAAQGNPGPAGLGVVLVSPEGQVVAEVPWFLGEKTCNEAEYEALNFGLWLAHERGVKRLEVYSDSELVIRQLEGEYKVKAANLRSLWRKANKRVQWFDKVRLYHCSREETQQADRLAHLAINRARKRRGQA
jgi:ribonuclease HI